MKLSIVYTVLAVLASLANIASQYLFTRAYSGPYAVKVSVLVGTAVGLVVKYLLDKRFIFSFQARDVVHDGQTFVLYALMGVFTTGIFWGFEFGFDAGFNTPTLRYLGGAIGLAIGYFCKYQLDKRFVFRKSSVL